jgi:hypothetical protein
VGQVNGSNELAGDTDLTFKYCTFIDWQQSHQSCHSQNRLSFVYKKNPVKLDSNHTVNINAVTAF